MLATIQDKEILIQRLNKWIKTLQYVLDNKRDMFWSSFEKKEGQLLFISKKEAKSRFQNLFIDRYKFILHAIETNNLDIDWIEYRDVFYWLCFNIPLLGEKSYKKLRESKKDLIIQVYKNDEYFESFLKVQTRFV